MGCQVILTIHQVDDGTQFDVTVANPLLMANSGFGELYEEFVGDPKFDGPFRYSKSGELQVANRWDSHFGGYKDHSMVWGCFGLDEAEQISKLITEGKIVFHLDIEGDDNEYYVCTPSTVKKVSAASITF